MSQEMNVLCCYSCKMFQVHIVKKANKWQCKMCNMKQTIQKVYYKGLGKDCRVCVQKLNSHVQPRINVAIEEQGETYSNQIGICQPSSSLIADNKKWSKYVTDSEIEPTSNVQTLPKPYENNSSNQHSKWDKSKTSISTCKGKVTRKMYISTPTQYEITEKKPEGYICDVHNKKLKIHAKDSCKYSVNSTNIFENYDDIDTELDF